MNNLRFGVSDDRGYTFNNITSSTPSLDKNQSSVFASKIGWNDFDSLGTISSFTNIKNISIEWVTIHHSLNQFEIESKKINKMLSLGRQNLFWFDGDVTKFIQARCINIKQNRDSSSYSPFMSENTATFEIYDSFWSSRENLWFIGDESIILGGGNIIVGRREFHEITTNGQTITFTNSSNNLLFPTISLTTILDAEIGAGPYTGGSNIILEITDSSGYIVKYNMLDNITSNQRYVINYLEGQFNKRIGDASIVSAYNSFEITTGVPFAPIQPNDFSIRIFGDSLSLVLEIDFNESWR